MRSVLVNGPSTAAALAERLQLTPAAVRRHLDQLLEEGILEAREPRTTAHRGRGRPAKVFALTEAGRDRFDQAYDDLAVQAIRFLAETGGRGGRARVRRPPRRQDRAALPRRRRRPSPTSTPGAGAGPGLHRRGVRRRGARRSRSASSCASSTARSPTWPTSSPSCARRRPPRSAGCSAATSNDWPPSPTATASAPPASRTSTTDTKRRGSLDDFHRRAQPDAQGHRPLRVRLVRQDRRRRRTRNAGSTRPSSATSPRRRASRSGCSTCA